MSSPDEAQNKATKPRCRTVDEAFAAGGEDPAAQVPLSERQIPQQALLWAPVFRAETAEAS